MRSFVSTVAAVHRSEGSPDYVEAFKAAHRSVSGVRSEATLDHDAAVQRLLFGDVPRAASVRAAAPVRLSASGAGAASPSATAPAATAAPRRSGGVPASARMSPVRSRADEADGPRAAALPTSPATSTAHTTAGWRAARRSDGVASTTRSRELAGGSARVVGASAAVVGGPSSTIASVAADSRTHTSFVRSTGAQPRRSGGLLAVSVSATASPGTASPASGMSAGPSSPFDVISGMDLSGVVPRSQQPKARPSQLRHSLPVGSASSRREVRASVPAFPLTPSGPSGRTPVGVELDAAPGPSVARVTTPVAGAGASTTPAEFWGSSPLHPGVGADFAASPLQHILVPRPVSGTQPIPVAVPDADSSEFSLLDAVPHAALGVGVSHASMAMPLARQLAGRPSISPSTMPTAAASPRTHAASRLSDGVTANSPGGAGGLPPPPPPPPPPLPTSSASHASSLRFLRRPMGSDLSDVSDVGDVIQSTLQLLGSSPRVDTPSADPRAPAHRQSPSLRATVAPSPLSGIPSVMLSTGQVVPTSSEVPLVHSDVRVSAVAAESRRTCCMRS
jgi:hypothetical protein